MNNTPKVADLESRKPAIDRLKQVCQGFDAQIAILDGILDRLEAENSLAHINQKSK